MVSVCGTMWSASPPVAMASASSPSSARSRWTIPSTWAAIPKMTPERIASMVDLPISERGSSRSTLGRRAARSVSASSEISIPSAMMPPRYSPAPETTSKVLAVPKSTTMHGPWKRS